MPATRGAEVGRGHMLVVDDDPEIAACVRTLLEQEGHRVGTAADEWDALAQIVGEEPKLVLLGPRLAPGKGRSLQQQVRERGFDIPIVFIGAATAPERRSTERSSSDLAALVQTVARLALAASNC